MPQFDVQIKLPHDGYWHRAFGTTPNKIAFPFIFTSKNFALKQHGATIVFDGASTTATEDSSFPVANLIDGNHSSICKIDNLSSYQSNSPIYNGMGKVHLDMSASIAAGDEINLIVLENDLRFPVHELSLSTYTANDFSTGKTDIKINEEFGGIVGVYEYGFQPKIDSIALGTATEFSSYVYDQIISGGHDGRFIFFGLQTPITSVAPYIELRFRMPGRNRFGRNADFQDGLHDFPDDETLETSDPNPAHVDSTSKVFGWNDNYMQVGDGTSLLFQRSRGLESFMRPDHLYVLQFHNKQFWAAGLDLTPNAPYQVQIKYMDTTGGVILTENLFEEIGLFDTSWNLRFLPINHKRDGARFSGAKTSALYDPEHKVPSEARGFIVEWKTLAQSTVGAKWQIDDICLYSAQNESVISELIRSKYGVDPNEHPITYPVIFDNSGTIKVKRIGFYAYDFATTKQRGTESFIQDLGGRASANPSGISYRPKGKVTSRNFLGQVIGQFVSKAGIKQSRVFEMIATKEQRGRIDDFYASSTPFGVIEPQGDFADYVIGEGSLNWRAIAAEKLSDPGDYFWQGSMVLEEI